MSRDSSRMSRVVPGMGVTMAASRCAARVLRYIGNECRMRGMLTKEVQKRAFASVWGAEYREANSGPEELAASSVGEMALDGG